MFQKIVFSLLIISLPFLSKAQSTTLSVSSGNFQNFQSTDLLNQEAIEFSSPYSTAHFNNVLDAANTKHPLVKTGKALTFVGIPLMILGGIMVSSADALYYNCTNGDCEGDAKGGFGVLILATGVGLTGTGIVLWTIGNKKSK